MRVLQARPFNGQLGITMLSDMQVSLLPCTIAQRLVFHSSMQITCVNLLMYQLSSRKRA